ncbi:hypothetical protein DIPPA_08761 [Diplonema papillatum]|nr:hypothetical protein DIPPA_08761 [Diplonema papillatum]
MLLRRSRALLAGFGGQKGSAVAAPSKGLGKYFQRTRAVMSFEPMYSPHIVRWDNPGDTWDEDVYGSYNGAMYIFFLFFIFAPFINAFFYYQQRAYAPHRVPLPGFANIYQELDDPDWRLKREMHVKEVKEGVRPSGYNRYLDIMKNVKVSDPDYKLYIPSEHGEAVGVNAADVIQRERYARQLAMRS